MGKSCKVMTYLREGYSSVIPKNFDGYKFSDNGYGGH